MKADIKLCDSSFSMVNLFSAFSRSSSRRMRAALDSWVATRFYSVKETFSVRLKVDWITIPLFDASLIRLTYPWCVGIIVWNRQEVSCDKTDRHTVRYPRTVSTEYRKYFRESVEVCSPNKFKITPTAMNCSWSFASRTNCVPKTSDDPKDKTQRSWSKNAVYFRMFSSIEEDKICLYRLCLSGEATFHYVWNSQEA
jgi:hypothetical protein